MLFFRLISWPFIYKQNIYIVLNWSPGELMLQTRDLLQLEQEIPLYYLQTPADF